MLARHCFGFESAGLVADGNTEEFLSAVAIVSEKRTYEIERTSELPVESGHRSDQLLDYVASRHAHLGDHRPAALW